MALKNTKNGFIYVEETGKQGEDREEKKTAGVVSVRTDQRGSADTARKLFFHGEVHNETQHKRILIFCGICRHSTFEDILI